MHPSLQQQTQRALERWAAQNGIALRDLGRLIEGEHADTNSIRSDSRVKDQRPTVYFPGLRAIPFWEKGSFTWASMVEGLVDRIRVEYRSSVRRLAGPRPSYERGNWSVQYLTCIGRLDSNATRHFPETVSALSRVPGALTCGMSYFSTIAPETHILPHCGFTNAHLRCHLTIATAEFCRIRVGQEVRSWKDGELLIFDDTFEHEVWNDSGAHRVVLLFDVFHPDISVDEARALEFLAGVWRRSIVSRRLIDGDMQLSHFRT